MSAEKESSISQHRLSCTKCFDALWFCYFFPSQQVHQLQQYYREGVLDNCYGKWSAPWDCLYLKTKPSSQLQEILEAREKAESHIWTFRTPEEAQAYWKQEFGHLNGRESK
ncbi:hypothetical protein ERO13_D09G092100v2 [Gossypium hirsutum]|uniref:Uncharacterized protein n=1 Tax=Gossypium mustelinum TaxID=34275 RepID=A0A5D2TKJ6_GOSMU|nr:hypothetical protein ERO13_D09G092100v2 [Gossypium hirsutum]TYI64748.1 hypothetical protein E1A91_D09G109500v1 [Gossypium mustelinum]